MMETLLEETEEPSRAVARLRQLAREERQAAADGDTEALCRIAALLGPATEAFSRVADSESLTPLCEDVGAAHKAAEALLTQRLAQTAESLKRCAAARRPATAYLRRADQATPQASHLQELHG